MQKNQIKCAGHQMELSAFSSIRRVCNGMYLWADDLAGPQLSIFWMSAFMREVISTINTAIISGNALQTAMSTQEAWFTITYLYITSKAIWCWHLWQQLIHFFFFWPCISGLSTNMLIELVMKRNIVRIISFLTTFGVNMNMKAFKRKSKSDLKKKWLRNSYMKKVSPLWSK